MLKACFVFLILIVGIHSLRAQWIKVDSEVVRTNGNSPFAVSGEDLFLSGYGVFRSTNDGITWTDVSGPIGTKWVTALAVADTGVGQPLLFAATDGKGVFRTSNDGVTWDSVNTGLQTHLMTAICATAGNVFVGTDQDTGRDGDSSLGIFRTRNNGSSWVVADSGLLDTAHSRAITAFAADRNGIFVGTGSGIYTSTDTGTSWTVLSLPQLIIAIALNGDTVYAADWNARNGFFISTDRGRNWTQADTGLPASYWSSIALYENKIFVMMNGAVYFSTDNGKHWRSASDGLTESVSTLIRKGPYLFAAGSNDVWRRSLSDFDLGVASANGEKAVQCSICPNPISRVAHISVTAPERERVTVRIVNQLGSQVASVFDGEVDAGERSISWNAAGLPDGVYAVVLRAGNSLRTMQAIVRE